MLEVGLRFLSQASFSDAGRVREWNVVQYRTVKASNAPAVCEKERVCAANPRPGSRNVEQNERHLYVGTCLHATFLQTNSVIQEIATRQLAPHDTATTSLPWRKLKFLG